MTSAAKRAPPDAWDNEAKRLIRSEMNLRAVTTAALAEALEKQFGEQITEKSLRLRLSRGSFSLAFALRVLRVLGVEELRIGHIHVPKPPDSNR